MTRPAVIPPAAYTKAGGRGKPQSRRTVIAQVAHQSVVQKLGKG